MDKIIGFLPDTDPTRPGAIMVCDNLVPTVNGMSGAPSPVTPIGVPALADECRNAVIVTKLDDSRRVFAGAQTKLYELVAGSWTDVSRAAVYTGGAENRWSFAQFGNSTLAANLTDTIQRSTTGAFADVATAPKAKIIFTVGAFVMALNTVDGTYGTTPNRWWCCASYDDTSWTPSVSTLATTGELVSTPGQITAGGRLGEYAIAYKERAIYIGQYVGAPVVWDWVQVAGGDYGCVGQDAWCDVGGAHWVVGLDSFILFDGSRPNPVGTGEVKQWFYNNSSPGFRYKCKCVFDKQNNTVWTFYPTKNSTVCDAALIYNLSTKTWGHATVTIEAAMNYISAGVTIDQLSSYSATIDGLSAYTFDSQFWLQGGRSLAIFNTSHQLQSMTGASTSSGFTTGDAGDDDTYSLMNKVKLRFNPGSKPLTATIQTWVKQNSGDGWSAGSTASIDDGKFDVLDSGRWHAATFSFTGDHTVSAIGASLIPEGTA